MTTTAAWTEHDLQIDGATVHYTRMGRSTGPALVLLHGFSDAGQCWLRLGTDLASEYDVVMPDAAGHGRTSPAAPGESPARSVADVVGIIDALGLERPVLIGHSMGAATAARLAGEAPDRVRGVVLEDPGWRDGVSAPTTTAAAGSRSQLRSPAWTTWMRSLKDLSPAERRLVADRERPEWAEEERGPWIEAKAQFNLDALAAMPAPTLTAWREIARRITCPVLLLTADVERGAIVTPEAAREAASLLPAVRVVHIPGAGHNIRREQYEPVRAAVRAFLAELAPPE